MNESLHVGVFRQVRSLHCCLFALDDIDAAHQRLIGPLRLLLGRLFSGCAWCVPMAQLWSAENNFLTERCEGRQLPTACGCLVFPLFSLAQSMHLLIATL